MDETYICKRVSQTYSQSYGGGMIDKFTALIIELLAEQAAQHSVQRTAIKPAPIEEFVRELKKSLESDDE